jgi:hypothetical protein
VYRHDQNANRPNRPALGIALSKRSESIAALLARCAKGVQALETAYADTLARQTIPADLKIAIKNLAGNLRSVLDYVAADVREVCCPTANPKDRFYFPVFHSEEDFLRKTSKWYPGLETARPTVWACLRSVQPYDPRFRWLGQLNRVNNENKHALPWKRTSDSEVARVAHFWQTS